MGLLRCWIDETSATPGNKPGVGTFTYRERAHVKLTTTYGALRRSLLGLVTDPF